MESGVNTSAGQVRLHELLPVVDKFVLVESTMTHSGKPKELLFDRNRCNAGVKQV